MLPIIEGCKALVIKSAAGNEGKTVTVGRFIGEVKGFIGSDRWELDGLLRGFNGNPVRHGREAWLMRIDGAGESQKDENQTNLTKSTT